MQIHYKTIERAMTKLLKNHETTMNSMEIHYESKTMKQPWQNH